MRITPIRRRPTTRRSRRRRSRRRGRTLVVTTTNDSGAGRALALSSGAFEPPPSVLDERIAGGALTDLEKFLELRPRVELLQLARPSEPVGERGVVVEGRQVVEEHGGCLAAPPAALLELRDSFGKMPVVEIGEAQRVADQPQVCQLLGAVERVDGGYILLR